MKYPLSNGEYMIIDDYMLPVVEHFSPVHKSVDGYGVVKFDGRTVKIHRLLSKPSRLKVIDHINGDKLDNRLDNLRAVRQVDNMNNRNGRRFKYGVSGVSYHTKRNKYLVRIDFYGERYYGGWFDKLEDAQACAKEAYARLLSV